MLDVCWAVQMSRLSDKYVDPPIVRGGDMYCAVAVGGEDLPIPIVGIECIVRSTSYGVSSNTRRLREMTQPIGDSSVVVKTHSFRRSTRLQ